MTVKGPIAIATIAATLAVGGCGGSTTTSTETTTGASTGATTTTSSSPSTPSDQQQIRTTVEKLLTSSDPDQVCKALVTPDYVKQSFGDLKGCEKASVPGSAARSAKVSGIEVIPGGATAKALPKGGPSGGETLNVSLALVSGGTWKVNRLRSNAPVGP